MNRDQVIKGIANLRETADFLASVADILNDKYREKEPYEKLTDAVHQEGNTVHVVFAKVSGDRSIRHMVIEGDSDASGPTEDNPTARYFVRDKEAGEYRSFYFSTVISAFDNSGRLV